MTKLGALQAIPITRFTELNSFSATITEIKDYIVAIIYDDTAPT